MFSFTLKNLKRDEDGFYNLFRQTYIDSDRLELYSTYVNSNEEMRLDKISNRLYGSSIYVEELMQVNNIINIWNIKSGDIILYSSIPNYSALKSLEKDIDKSIESISKPNKKARIDPDRSKQVPPTIKPKSLENLTLDKKNRKIKINGRLS